MFTKLSLLALVWLCCCCMSCDPMDGYYYVGYVKALKPADVDSLEMRAYSGDSLVATEYCFSTEHGSEASFFLRDYCEGEERAEQANKNCDFTIAITFFCGDKKVDLPLYELKTKNSSSGFADDLQIYIAEFDERKISGDYTVETFLAPEDTSCGKFVNYAVLKVEED